MDSSEYLRQKAIIEDCRQSYYDNMVRDITECDDYEDEDDYDDEDDYEDEDNEDDE